MTRTNTIDHDEVGDQLLLGRVDDLAQLGDHLPVERGELVALVGSLPSPRPRTALLSDTSVTSSRRC